MVTKFTKFERRCKSVTFGSRIEAARYSATEMFSNFSELAPVTDHRIIGGTVSYTT